MNKKIILTKINYVLFFLVCILFLAIVYIDQIHFREVIHITKEPAQVLVANITG